MSLRAAITGLALMAPVAALAQTLEFPAFATPVAEKISAAGSYFLPTAPFVDGPLEGITAEGAVQQQSWKLGGSLTTLQILAPLRDQLESEGFTTLFECESRICGGFDFRYQIEVLPEPDMHVNLGDYRYLTARRQADGAPEYVGLIVSRSAGAGFVQLTRVGNISGEARIAASTKAEPSVMPQQGTVPVGKQLETKGHAALSDLSFRVGSSELGDRQFASLAELAKYLSVWPNRRVVLVGHTDAEGSLEANIALSRRRAAAVVERLIKAHGVNPGQVSADGVGFLAPRSSNLTVEGRSLNRRVEVILSTTE